MPTSFAAFTFRDGYPRRLPDKGTYWHLGKEVKSRIRGKVKPWHHPEIKGLFPDAVAEGTRYYKKTGIFHINHGMVMKRSIAERHPWAVLNVLKAFEKANKLAAAQRKEHTGYYVDAGLLPPGARDVLASNIVQHGVVANRKTLETAARYSYEQGLTPRLIGLDEVFAESTMDQ